MATVDTKECKALKPGKLGKAAIIFSPILHLAKLPLNKLNHISREIRKHANFQIGLVHLMMADECEKFNCCQCFYLVYFCLNSLVDHTRLPSKCVKQEKQH